MLEVIKKIIAQDPSAIVVGSCAVWLNGKGPEPTKDIDIVVSSMDKLKEKWDFEEYVSMRGLMGRFRGWGEIDDKKVDIFIKQKFEGNWSELDIDGIKIKCRTYESHLQYRRKIDLLMKDKFRR